MKTAQKCPQCGSKRAVRIMYGMPAYEAFLKAEKGEIALGGCVITGNDPQWQCQDCWTRWNDELVWPGPPPKKLERMRRDKVGVGWWTPEPVAREDIKSE